MSGVWSLGGRYRPRRWQPPGGGDFLQSDLVVPDHLAGSQMLTGLAFLFADPGMMVIWRLRDAK